MSNAEDRLKKLYQEQKKTAAFKGVDFKFLKKDVRDEMVKNAIASLGAKAPASKGPENKKNDDKVGMVNVHARNTKP
jgi:hypothetical protein